MKRYYQGIATLGQVLPTQKCLLAERLVLFYPVMAVCRAAQAGTFTDSPERRAACVSVSPICHTRDYFLKCLAGD
jgi:hypothetical protein